MSGSNAEKFVEIVRMTSEVVSAYVSHNHVAPADLPSLIGSVHASLSHLGRDTGLSSEEETTEKPSASQVRKSVKPDGIVSFIDGKTYKTLKRHLTSHGLDPESYRDRFGLPADYPMVALSYSEKRSSLAKSLGLGRPASNSSKSAAPAAALGNKRKRA